MKAAHVALCSLLLSSLALEAARADEAAPAEAALRAVVERDFLKPLVERQRERSRFSRAASPAREYRVGTLRASLVRDARGLAFATFTVDQQFLGAREWSTATMGGCIYPHDGTIFVKRGDAYVAASFALGKQSPQPPAGVCLAADVAAKQ